MKVRKSRKNLRKSKKLELTKALRVAHNDFSVVKRIDISSPKLY
jgi:type VI protein secretion system component Hcp